MKIIILLMIFFYMYAVAQGQDWPMTACTSNHCDVCYKDRYTKLVFSDEFDGDYLDENKWVAQWGIMRKPQETKQFYYGENNIEVSNGTLKIRVNKLTSPITPTYWYDGEFYTGDFYYTSAEIHSLFQFGYGKYEIRCLLPEGAGFWPAFWLYSDNPWDEIDVFDEMFNDNNTNNEITDELNHRKDINYWEAACAHHVSPSYSGCGSREIIKWNLVDFSQWHTFTLYYSPWAISIEIDNGNTFTWTQSILRWPTTGEFVNQCTIPGGSYFYADGDCFLPKKPMNIILNVAVQTGYDPGNGILEVDYVRYYSNKDCCNNLVINNKSELNLNSNYLNYYNFLCGNTIKIDGDITINSGENLHLVADDEIIIENLDVENGAFFEAETKPVCNTNKSIEEKEWFSISTDEKNYAIKVFPNPVTHILNVEINNKIQKVYNCSILNIDGSIIYSTKEYTNRFSINLIENNIPNGIYLFKIYDEVGNLLFLKKIVILNL